MTTPATMVNRPAHRRIPIGSLKTKYDKTKTSTYPNETIGYAKESCTFDIAKIHVIAESPYNTSPDMTYGFRKILIIVSALPVPIFIRICAKAPSNIEIKIKKYVNFSPQFQ
ncbi:hypothetical protein ACT8ZS_05010 [Paenibacillus sp. M.A.Huq-84]